MTETDVALLFIHKNKLQSANDKFLMTAGCIRCNLRAQWKKRFQAVTLPNVKKLKKGEYLCKAL